MEIDQTENEKLIKKGNKNKNIKVKNDTNENKKTKPEKEEEALTNEELKIIEVQERYMEKERLKQEKELKMLEAQIPLIEKERIKIDQAENEKLIKKGNKNKNVKVKNDTNENKKTKPEKEEEALTNEELKIIEAQERYMEKEQLKQEKEELKMLEAQIRLIEKERIKKEKEEQKIIEAQERRMEREKIREEKEEEQRIIREQRQREREEQEKQRLVIREKRKREKEEQERIDAKKRKEAALTQMRYLLSVCEQYADIFKKNNDSKALKSKNTFVPTLDDIEDIKQEVKTKKKVKDYDVRKYFKYFEGGKLHEYQVEGVTWMYMLYSNASNGILADEMGLGKTVQVIALISVLLAQKVSGPFLIVAPLSTIPNWKSEFARFAPKIPVVEITGMAAVRRENVKKLFQKHKINDFETYPVVLGTYQSPLLEMHSLEKFKWRYIIIDEGHRIKNPNSQLGVKLRSLRSENRLLLTGTPLQNNIVELWALLNFLLPNFFTDMTTFTELVMLEDFHDENKIIQEEQSNNLVSKIHKVLEPFMLRRLKSDVLTNMVPKKEVTVYCPMSPLQLKLYNSVIEKNISALKGEPEEIFDPNEPRQKRKCVGVRDYTYKRLDEYIDQNCLMETDRSVEDLDESEISGLVVDKSDMHTSTTELKKFHDTMIRLTMQSTMMMFRKIVNHPYLVHFPLDPNSEKKQLLVDEDLVKNSGKLLVLDTLLPALKKRGHKILLFSQLVIGLDLIEEYMILRNYNYRRLDGSHSLEQRAVSMREFNTDPSVFIFLLSTRAGGLGLNLTGADTVIFFDRDWNPQVDIQAQDRCHRIGQTKPVVIYSLTSKNTIDDNVINAGQVKRVLEKVVIANGKFKTIPSGERQVTESMWVELREALKKPESNDSYIFSNNLELNRLLDRSDLYDIMKKNDLNPNKKGNKENKKSRAQ